MDRKCLPRLNPDTPRAYTVRKFIVFIFMLFNKVPRPWYQQLLWVLVKRNYCFKIEKPQTGVQDKTMARNKALREGLWKHVS